MVDQLIVELRGLVLWIRQAEPLSLSEYWFTLPSDSGADSLLCLQYITQTTLNINGYYYLYKLSIIVKLEWNLTTKGGVGVKESKSSEEQVLGYSALLAYILHPRESAGALDSSWGAR